MSEEKKRHINNNLYLYYSLSNHKIGEYSKHQTILSPGNVKARKAVVISFMQENISFEKSKN